MVALEIGLLTWVTNILLITLYMGHFAQSLIRVFKKLIKRLFLCVTVYSKTTLHFMLVPRKKIMMHLNIIEVYFSIIIHLNARIQQYKMVLTSPLVSHIPAQVSFNLHTGNIRAAIFLFT
jgi:hypothetical protein